MGVTVSVFIDEQAKMQRKYDTAKVTRLSATKQPPGRVYLITEPGY